MDSSSDLIRITYIKSGIGYARRQKDTISSLGLRRLGDSVIQPDTAAIRGMVRAVQHLVQVEPVPEAVPEGKAEAPTAESAAETEAEAPAVAKSAAEAAMEEST